MPKRLREAINDVVVQYVTSKLERGGPLDVAFMALEITGSLIDIVLEQDEKYHGPLLAQIVEHLSGEYLERRGLIQQKARQLAGKWGPPGGHFRISRPPGGFRKMPEVPTAPYDSQRAF